MTHKLKTFMFKFKHKSSDQNCLPDYTKRKMTTNREYAKSTRPEKRPGGRDLSVLPSEFLCAHSVGSSGMRLRDCARTGCLTRQTAETQNWPHAASQNCLPA